MFRNDTPPPPAGQAAECEPDALQDCARQLLDAVAAEPVPERLRDLALALEEALERRRAASSPSGAAGPHDAG